MATPEFILKLREKIGHDLLWLIGVTAYVEDDEGRILLGRRADTGEWAPVYGINEPGEEPADTVVREVMEETGVAVVPTELAAVKAGTRVTTYANGDNTMYLDLLFICRPREGAAGAANGGACLVGREQRGVDHKARDARGEQAVDVGRKVEREGVVEARATVKVGAHRQHVVVDVAQREIAAAQRAARAVVYAGAGGHEDAVLAGHDARTAVRRDADSGGANVGSQALDLVECDLGREPDGLRSAVGQDTCAGNVVDRQAGEDLGCCTALLGEGELRDAAHGDALAAAHPRVEPVAVAAAADLVEHGDDLVLVCPAEGAGKLVFGERGPARAHWHADKGAERVDRRVNARSTGVSSGVERVGACHERADDGVGGVCGLMRRILVGVGGTGGLRKGRQRAEAFRALLVRAHDARLESLARGGAHLVYRRKAHAAALVELNIERDGLKRRGAHATHVLDKVLCGYGARASRFDREAGGAGAQLLVVRAGNLDRKGLAEAHGHTHVHGALARVRAL